MSNRRCHYTYNGCVKHISLVFLREPYEAAQSSGQMDKPQTRMLGFHS